MTLTVEPEVEVEDEAAPVGRSLQTVLIVVLSLALLAVFAAGGYVVGHRHASASTPTSTSIDAGFAYDMSVHHQQAVTMAGYTRDHTTDPAIKTLAYDIETSQFDQIGQFQGWLDTWGLSSVNPNAQMAWMGGSMQMDMSSGLMPGMATVAQITKLESLTGKALDIFFLQLMLHHHQGGVPMAQYAAAHATTPYVRNAAEKMATAQGAEIVLTEQLLRQRGASPLPPPA